MADTGVTTFAGASTALRANSPNNFTETSLQSLNKADILLPYMYDVVAAYLADTVTYPDATTLSLALSLISSIIIAGE